MTNNLSRHLVMVLLGVEQLDRNATRELIKLASKNNVLLALLRRAGIRGSLREAEEKRYSVFLNWLGRISNLLEETGVDHLFIKLIKPAEYVPADIDILVRPEDLPEVVASLGKLGLQILVKEPFTVTLGGKGALIDLYTYPSFAHIVYLDPSILWDSPRSVDVGGVTVRVPSLESEVVLALAHAVYKEGVLTANDVLMIILWYRAVTNLVKDAFIGDAYWLTLSVADAVLRGRACLPYRVPLSLRAYFFAKKTLRDRVFRRTLPIAFRYMRDPRLGVMFLKHLRR